MKFSMTQFLVKLTSRHFWAYLFTTYITYTLLLIDGDRAWFLPLIVVWGVITVLYIGGNVLIDALGKMIEKANLTINQNNSVNATISGTVKGVDTGGKG
jgi:hypothetical protein